MSGTNPDKKMKIAYDIKLRRPGCALIQAHMGGSTAIAADFPTDSWVLVPTPDMKVYEVSGEQLQILIKRAERKEYEERRVSTANS